jgi:ATP diphosphatase
MENKDKYSIQDLLQLMERLRSPINGCPWDVEQNFQTIKPHTIEEAYEVADAIERNDMNDLKDELGDLLFQVIFHAQMAHEDDLFTFDDIVDHVTKKMIFRHPHVFSDTKADNAKAVKDNVWEQQKDKERNSTIKNNHYLDKVTHSLPSLSLANKIQKNVHKVGFKYTTIEDVFQKLDEELNELKQAIASKNQKDIEEEYGDVLIVSALLAHHIDSEKTAEDILRESCFKFIKRFNAVEDHLKKQNVSLDQASINQMMDTWSIIKNTQKP